MSETIANKIKDASRLFILPPLPAFGVIERIQILSLAYNAAISAAVTSASPGTCGTESIVDIISPDGRRANGN
jgi:hypothetical protein